VALKADIDRLIAKGLSGREAGRLAVQELMELDYGGQGFLSDRDILAIKAALRTPEDGADYHRMLDLHEALRLMLCEAHLVSLQTEQLLGELQRQLERYRVSAQVAELSRLYVIAASLEREDAAEPSAGGVEPRECGACYWLAELGDVMHVRRIEETYAASGGRPLAELLGDLRKAAAVSASALLAFLQVIEEASAVAGVHCADSWARVPRELDILLGPHESEDLLADVRRAARSYNLLAQAVAEDDGEIAYPHLPAFELAELEPDELAVAILRIRIANEARPTGLGPEWWSEKR
jgi:hypothetical protein